MAGDIAEMLLDGTMDHETGEWNFDGEDGPGWPMTGAEAAEYRRGFAPTRHASRPKQRHRVGLDGVWRIIGEALDLSPAGCGELIDRVLALVKAPVPDQTIEKHLRLMKHQGLVTDASGSWVLTKTGRKRLNQGRGINV